MRRLMSRAAVLFWERNCEEKEKLLRNYVRDFAIFRVCFTISFSGNYNFGFELCLVSLVCSSWVLEFLLTTRKFRVTRVISGTIWGYEDNKMLRLSKIYRLGTSKHEVSMRKRHPMLYHPKYTSYPAEIKYVANYYFDPLPKLLELLDLFGGFRVL